MGQDVDGLCVNVSACCWTVPCGFWGSGGGVGQDVDGLATLPTDQRSTAAAGQELGHRCYRHCPW